MKRKQRHTQHMHAGRTHAECSPPPAIARTTMLRRWGPRQCEATPCSSLKLRRFSMTVPGLSKVTFSPVIATATSWGFGCQCPWSGHTAPETVGLLGTVSPCVPCAHARARVCPELCAAGGVSAARQTVQLREFSSTSRCVCVCVCVCDLYGALCNSKTMCPAMRVQLHLSISWSLRGSVNSFLTVYIHAVELLLNFRSHSPSWSIYIVCSVMLVTSALFSRGSGSFTELFPLLSIVDTTDGAYWPAQLKATHRRPWPDLVLFYMVLFVHRIPEVLSRTGKRGWGGGRGEEPGSARRHWIAHPSAPTRKDRSRRPPAIARTTMLRRWGPRQCEGLVFFANWCFSSCAEQSHKDGDPKATVEDLAGVLLYVHRNRRFIRDGSPERPPRLSHTSWALATLKDNSAARQTVQLREFSSTSLLLISTGLC